MLFPLSKLSIGHSAKICLVSDHKPICKRLLDLGFEPGACVLCVLKKGSEQLSAFLIKGAVIALRREDADLVLVQEFPEEQEVETL